MAQIELSLTLFGCRMKAYCNMKDGGGKKEHFLVVLIHGQNALRWAPKLSPETSRDLNKRGTDPRH